ncbi:MAG: DUF1566 domain-containing protein [Candidatus Electrothrix sp. AW2]|nr:DUF1566 domain-containing protein [Candidatus Electrothrix gigas]
MQKKLLYHKKKQRKIIRRVAVPLAAVFCCGIGSADAFTDPPSPPSPCGAGRPLPANTWLMTAPSCEPIPADLASQYDDDLNGPHNTGWLSFTWDSAPTAQNYVKQAGSDSLVLGTGNWLYSYKAGTLLLDGTATPTVPCSDYGSGLMGRCFAVDLTPSSGRNLWQIIGHPFPYPVSWDDVRVASSDGTTWTQYTPSEAATANLMAKEYWFWNGSSYQTKDDSTPGAIGVLQPQESIWVRIKADSSSLSAGDFKLLIPAAHEPTPPVRALNDTGITWSGNYAAGNNDTCVASNTPDGDNVVVAQDCSHGRDAIHNDDSDGHAGFSYTKLDSNGEPLPDQTVDYATTPWACVKDNVTGLIWEVKTDDDGLHDKDDTYNWYNTNPATNGGAVGSGDDKDNTYPWYSGSADDGGDICYGYNSDDSSTFCNTEAYVNRVNTAGLCGANDWRMPTRMELRSLIHYGRYNPAIDTNYFPNALSSDVWSGSPFADDSGKAWYVGFYYGSSDADGRRNNFVRLVRSKQ